MKILRWLPLLGLAASVFFAVKELGEVRRVLGVVSALTPAGGKTPDLGRLASQLSASDSSGGASAGSIVAKLAAAQAGEMARLEQADPESAQAAAQTAAPRPAARTFPPRPRHVALGDSNSLSGKILAGVGGRDKAVKGGAVILDADGRRLEIAPSARKPAASASVAAQATAAVKALPKLALPSLDDRRLGLEARRKRAYGILVGTAAASFAFVLWLRRRFQE